MKPEQVYFKDVLFTVADLGYPEEVWYEVMCVGGATENALNRAIKKLKGVHTLRRPHVRSGFVSRKFVGADNPGTFDEFIGKYVGEFIEKCKQLSLLD